METEKKREMLLKLADIQSEIEDAIFYLENKQDQANSLKKSWSALGSIDKITEQLQAEVNAEIEKKPETTEKFQL